MLIIDDFRHGIRSVHKRPWQSLAIFLIIAIGIGMSSTYYSVAEALLLRPLPFDPDGQLFQIEQRLLPSGSRIMNSHQNLNDLREQSRTLVGVAVYQGTSGNMAASGQLEYAQGMKVDRYFFPLLGVAPALGRGFNAEDEQEQKPGSIILSHTFWQRRFAGDQTILGKEIRLDRGTYTVIGIMPQSFYFPFVEQTEEDFWLPLRDKSTLRGDYDKYGIARIKPEAELRQAEAEVTLIGSHLRQANPGQELHSFRLHPYREVIMDQLRPMLLNLAGLMVCVLVVVCINVASLLLVEAMRYRHEVEIRFALGGARWQLARLFLLRALALSFFGGLAGAGLAWILVTLIRQVLPAGFPGVSEIALNIRWLGFTIAVSLGTGIGFGFWPALKATQKLHQASITATRLTSIRHSTQSSRRYLVTLQLTFSTAFLVVTGLLAMSFYRLLNVDLGIRLDHRLLVMVRPTDSDLRTAESLQNLFLRIREEFLSLPGVQGIAVSSYAPLGAHSTRDFRINGMPPPKDRMEWMAQDNTVSNNYFEELGIAVRAGRSFRDEDHKDGKAVAIVNEAFTQRFFAGTSPLGREICFSSNGICEWREIVGVAMNVRDSRIDSPPEPTYFIPFTQAQPELLSTAAFTMRTNVDPTAVLGSIAKQVMKLPPRAMGMGPFTLEEMRSRQLMGPRQRVWFLAAITFLALLLSAMGVYGVIAGAVEQRRREIGIRMALGAAPEQITRLFYRQMVHMLFPGLLIGLGGAALLVRYLTSIFFGTTPIDPVAYCGATLVLSAVATMATALPVRRALRVSAAEVLRTE